MSFELAEIFAVQTVFRGCWLPSSMTCCQPWRVRSCPTDHGRSLKRIAAVVTVPGKM